MLNITLIQDKYMAKSNFKYIFVQVMVIKVKQY